MAKKKNRLGSVSNFIGGLGYISVSFQWLWSVVPLLYPLKDSQLFQTYFMPAESTTQTTPLEPFSPSLPSGVETLIVIASIVFALVIIIYVIVAVPRNVGKLGKAVTTKSAKTLIPAITQHKKITEKERRSLMSRISWSIKALLVFIPVFLLFIAIPENFGLTQDQFIAAGIVLGISSALLFLLQYGLSKIAKLPSDNTW